MASGIIQPIWFAAEKRKEAERAAFLKYVDRYIESTQKKRCTCSACKTEKAIHPIQIATTKRSVEVVWGCDVCGRKVLKSMPFTELVRTYNIDRKEQRITAC